MPSLYPTAFDEFVDPPAEELMDAEGFEHDLAHSALNAAILALQTKVGIDESEDAESLEFRVAALEEGGGSGSGDVKSDGSVEMAADLSFADTFGISLNSGRMYAGTNPGKSYALLTPC